MATKKLAMTALVATLALAGCNTDGSVNWNAVGGVAAGIGAATLGAAEIYSASRPVYYTPPSTTVVVVCPRWSWSC